ncbi:MAG: LuxR family transcriptional regulator [Novosphingobium sp.]|nr:LuxR family transcriptional regulator [Novosphingobium sp.]MCP5389704.1 LuxR family transcriptional regulator [Novosphingobium sp.]
MDIDPHGAKSIRLALVDMSSRRRAFIVHELSHFGVHVEPFSNMNELDQHRPCSDLILAHDGNGIIGTLLRNNSERSVPLPVIAFAEDPDPRMIITALRAGAADYLIWPFAWNEFSLVIQEAYRRVRSVSGVQSRIKSAQERVARLSGRERQVLSCLLRGLSNREIGAELEISHRTAETHRANMLAKLQAHSTPEAIRIAIEAGQDVSSFKLH